MNALLCRIFHGRYRWRQTALDGRPMPVFCTACETYRP